MCCCLLSEGWRGVVRVWCCLLSEGWRGGVVRMQCCLLSEGVEEGWGCGVVYSVRVWRRV